MPSRIPARLALVAIALALLGVMSTGCGDDITEISSVVEQFFNQTRANSIMTLVSTYWFKPTGLAINPGNADLEFLRVFCCSNGTAIYAFIEGDDAVGDDLGVSIPYAGFIEADGTMHEPVQLKGDFQQASVSSMQLVFNANGDASIMFIAIQDEDPTSPDDDDPSRRVYYTYFRQAFAGTADNGDGLVYGFNQVATAIDRNTPLDDEGDDLGSTFVSTNLIAGTLTFQSDYSELEYYGCSGSRGLDLDWLLFFGWHGVDTSGTDPEDFLEGVFINLDSSDEDYMMPFNTIELDTDPELAFDESDSIDDFIITSFGDIAFAVMDSDNGEGVAQTSLNLVRVDLSGAEPDLTDAIAINRGTSLTACSIDGALMLGAAREPFTGQTATWILLNEDGYTDATVTNDDADIVIARVPADATSTNDIEIDEFDAEAGDSGTSNDAGLQSAQIARGLTHLVVYFAQAADDPGGLDVSTSYWAIGVVASDGSASDFTNLVSDPVLLTPDADDDEGDTDASNLSLAGDIDLFNPAFIVSTVCGPDSDPLNFAALYQREVDESDSLETLNLAMLEFSAVEQDPSSQIALTLALEEITEQDIDWNLNGGTLFDGGNGGWVVFYRGQGNNPDDNETEGAFDEDRLYFFGTDLHGSQSTNSPIEVGSGVLADDLLFPDYRTLLSYQVHVTPGNQFAGHDFTFDLESADPQLVHLLLNEYDASPSNSSFCIRYRLVDLRDSGFATIEDRFTPGLDEAPSDVIDPSDDVSVADVWSEGNNAMLFIEHDDSDGQLAQVSTLDTSTWTWVCPANYTNDDPVISIKINWLRYIPGWTQTTCCPRIVGGWVFWNRALGNESRLQARRIFATELPDEQ